MPLFVYLLVYLVYVTPQVEPLTPNTDLVVIRGGNHAAILLVDTEVRYDVFMAPHLP